MTSGQQSWPERSENRSSSPAAARFYIFTAGAWAGAVGAAAFFSSVLCSADFFSVTFLASDFLASSALACVLGAAAWAAEAALAGAEAAGAAGAAGAAMSLAGAAAVAAEAALAGAAAAGVAVAAGVAAKTLALRKRAALRAKRFFFMGRLLVLVLNSVCFGFNRFAKRTIRLDPPLQRLHCVFG